MLVVRLFCYIKLFNRGERMKCFKEGSLESSKKQSVLFNGTLNFGRGLVLLLTLGMAQQAVATGVSFSQYRIALDEKQRYNSLMIMNGNKQDTRCNIGFSHQQVLPNGDTKSVKSSEQVFNSAANLVRYSPKRVSVKAFGSQTVRLSLKRKKDLPVGEYISYLKLSCRLLTSAAVTNSNVISSKIHYNIPIIARVGKLNATVKLSSATVRNNVLQLTIEREGNRSLYGDFTVTDQQTNKVIGRRNALSVFLPTKLQILRIKLTEKPKGSLLIEFSENKQYGGNQKASLLVKL